MSCGNSCLQGSQILFFNRGIIGSPDLFVFSYLSSWEDSLPVPADFGSLLEQVPNSSLDQHEKVIDGHFEVFHLPLTYSESFYGLFEKTTCPENVCSTWRNHAKLANKGLDPYWDSNRWLLAVWPLSWSPRFSNLNLGPVWFSDFLATLMLMMRNGIILLPLKPSSPLSSFPLTHGSFQPVGSVVWNPPQPCRCTAV